MKRPHDPPRAFPLRNRVLLYKAVSTGQPTRPGTGQRSWVKRAPRRKLAPPPTGKAVLNAAGDGGGEKGAGLVHCPWVVVSASVRRSRARAMVRAHRRMGVRVRALRVSKAGAVGH